ncbi:unnamed protein product [Caenorhabditis brenneri]
MASFLIKLTLGALILLAYAAHSSPLGTFKKDSFMDSAWKFGQEHMLKLIAASVFLVIFLVILCCLIRRGLRDTERIAYNAVADANKIHFSPNRPLSAHTSFQTFRFHMAYSILPASILFCLILFSGVEASESEPYEFRFTTKIALAVLSVILPIVAVAFYIALGAEWCGCVKECKWYLQLLACILFYCPLPFICGYIAFKNWTLCVACWCIGFVSIIFLGCLNIGIFLCCVNMDNIIKRKVPPRGEAWNRFMNFLRGNQGQNNHAEAGGAGAAAPGNNPPGHIEMSDLSTSVVDEPSSHNA